MSSEWWHDFHEVLVNVIDIVGVAVNETLLRVGAGKEVLGEVDSPVIKYPDGSPFIPGSSIKGVFRSFVESYLYNIIIGNIKNSKCNSVFTSMSVKADDFINKCVNIIGENVEKSEEYCVNHALFGSQAGFSHLVFFDMVPEGNVELMVKPGTSIDRFLGSVREGTLFKEEYIVPGVKWKFRLRIYGVLGKSDDKWCCAREALAAVLKAFTTTGLSVGGRKSATGGLLKLDPDKTIVKITSFSSGGIIEEELPIQEFIEKLRGCK